MATLVVLSTPRVGEEEALQTYVQQVMPLLVGAGGTVVKRVGITDVVAGSPGPGFVFVMDFEKVTTIQDVFRSPAYAALIPVRDRGFERMEILITEDLPSTGG
ncbi:hypothetical protein MNBD_ACTINO02-1044 [hydrothermal vent metagenome]|uniref:DUF1330 domain-containing protein n=1 Tax=hydrothermal vent metagenome TaxID=652676 RepID=A0A3B0SDL0_9ZZZZ